MTTTAITAKTTTTTTTAGGSVGGVLCMMKHKVQCITTTVHGNQTNKQTGNQAIKSAHLTLLSSLPPQSANVFVKGVEETLPELSVI